MRLVGGVPHGVVKNIVLEIFMRVEILIDGIDLREEGVGLLVSVTHWSESFPEGLCLVS